MNIAQIHLRNLRGIEHLSLDLRATDGNPRNRLILLGGNGCGKTTVLLAIAHVVGRESRDFGALRLAADDVRKSRRPDDTSPLPPALPEGSIELDVRSTAEDCQWWDRKYLPGEKPPASATLRASLQDLSGVAALDARWLKGRELVAADLSGGGARVQTILAGRSHPPAVFLPATRGALEAGDQISVASVDQFSPRLGCLAPTRQRFDVLPSLLALAFMAPERNDRPQTVQRMWRVLEKYFPEMPRPVGVRGLQLLFETAQGAVVPLSRLSDGQRALLLIMSELAIRNPAGGIVLIDEIEQHLHPRWQRAIVDALPALLPTAQFILTSQAPYLAASAPDDVIVIGDWKRDGPQA